MYFTILNTKVLFKLPTELQCTCGVQRGAEGVCLKLSSLKPKGSSSRLPV